MVDYLARALQGATTFDPNAVRDVTIGQLQALYGKRRAVAAKSSQVMPYSEILRRTYVARGIPADEAARMAREHPLVKGGNKNAASRQ